MIRVLVAEDSPTARTLLVAILRADPEIEIAGEATNGSEAVAMTRALGPSVVTMDIRMPKMDGYEATRQIMIVAPTPIVIVSGSLDVREVEVSMHALKAGALTVLPKPTGPLAPDFRGQARRLVDTVKAMARVKVVRRWPAPPPPEGPRTLPALDDWRPRVVAVAASTGGPAALETIFSQLPPDFSLPVLAVQHIAPGFGEGFAAWLNATGSLRVKIAADGEELVPGTAYLPPDDRHLGARAPATAVVTGHPPVDGFRPSASYLFESVARAFGSAAFAVILTGMGRDGVAGLRAVRAAGGRVVAQDEPSSVVFGMPAAAIDAGLADAVLPLSEIAAQLALFSCDGTPRR